MRVSEIVIPHMRSAFVVIAISFLLILASLLLLISFRFGFTAGEMIGTPNAAPDSIASLKRAADMSLALFAVVLILFASVVVRAGVLKAQLHWIARSGAAFVVGAIASCFMVRAMLTFGGLPSSPGRALLMGLADSLANWIRQHV